MQPTFCKFSNGSQWVVYAWGTRLKSIAGTSHQNGNKLITRIENHNWTNEESRELSVERDVLLNIWKGRTIEIGSCNQLTMKSEMAIVEQIRQYFLQTRGTTYSTPVATPRPVAPINIVDFIIDGSSGNFVYDSRNIDELAINQTLGLGALFQLGDWLGGLTVDSTSFNRGVEVECIVVNTSCNLETLRTIVEFTTFGELALEGQSRRTRQAVSGVNDSIAARAERRKKIRTVKVDVSSQIDRKISLTDDE